MIPVEPRFWHRDIRRRRHGRRRGGAAFRWFRRTVAALFVAALVVPVVVAAQICYVAAGDSRPPSDVIVVMGAAQYDGEPSEVFTARLKHAAELYHQDVAPRIVTVGASLEGDTHTEAGAAARWLAAQGEVPRQGIVAKRAGGDTLQSLRAARDAMKAGGWTSAVIVTDPWHSLRSREMLRDMGVGAQTSPARDGNPVVGPLRLEARYIARETLAHLYYLVFGQSTDLELYSI